jgi:hypothetical protein
MPPNQEQDGSFEEQNKEVYLPDFPVQSAMVKINPCLLDLMGYK